MSAPEFMLGPVWTHDKRNGHVVKVGVREFKGTRFLDLRLWVGGGAISTTKGAVIPLDAVASLANALLEHGPAIASCSLQDGF